MIRSSVDHGGQAKRARAKVSASPNVNGSAPYTKIVEWSDEDRCFVGSCSGIIGPCCHGDDEVEVYRQLCQIVDEWLEIAAREDRRGQA